MGLWMRGVVFAVVAVALTGLGRVAGQGPPAHGPSVSSTSAASWCSKKRKFLGRVWVGQKCYKVYRYTCYLIIWDGPDVLVRIYYRYKVVPCDLKGVAID